MVFQLTTGTVYSESLTYCATTNIPTQINIILSLFIVFLPFHPTFSCQAQQMAAAAAAQQAALQQQALQQQQVRPPHPPAYPASVQRR